MIKIEANKKQFLNKLAYWKDSLIEDNILLTQSTYKDGRIVCLNLVNGNKLCIDLKDLVLLNWSQDKILILKDSNEVR